MIPDAVARLEETRTAIARAARDVGRKPGEVTLIAVSKTKPAEEILPVLEAGQIDFGENYVQEAKEKWPALRERFPQARLHMIGPLQSNKAREAVALFDVIQSLDRESLAKELSREIARSGRAPQLVVQVNTGAEPQKGGVLPAEVDGFLTLCRVHYGLSIAGLMCIPPVEDQPSPHFALLKKIAARNGLSMLSMGMSADYEAAIQLGATHVRVGSAIFGARG
jgi:pyridoxal phosphate enzyme (YggS family)